MERTGCPPSHRERHGLCDATNLRRVLELMFPMPAWAVMDQRYVNTVRACKVLLRNLDHLEETITLGQRTELTRLIEKLRVKLDEFLDEDTDEGEWIGEE